MEGLTHQVIHPINAGRRPALTPVAIVLAILAAVLGLAPSSSAAERNVSAAAAQYPVASRQNVAPDTGATVPLGEEAGPEAAPTEPVPEQIVAPAVADEPAAGSSPRRGEFRLPFTGHLVVPLLLAGGMLLTAGLALRRRVSGAPA